MARVHVGAKATPVVREGTGFGHASTILQGNAHEPALKTAETDATKGALVRDRLDQGWTIAMRGGLDPYAVDVLQNLPLRADQPLVDLIGPGDNLTPCDSEDVPRRGGSWRLDVLAHGLIPNLEPKNARHPIAPCHARLLRKVSTKTRRTEEA